MTEPESERTLRDVAEVAAELRRSLDAVNARWSEQAVSGRELFVSPSPAARDAVLPGYRQLIRDTLGYVNLVHAAALDHCDQLCLWGTAAGNGESTPVWAPWSVARSLVELCSVAAWLTEARVSPFLRVSRTLTLHHSEALSREQLTGESVDDEIGEIAETARRLHISPVIQRRRGWVGYEQGMPSRSSLVRRLLQGDDETRFDRMYSMLSAASHGETWAIYTLGYKEGPRDRATGVVLTEKSPPAFWLWTALSLSLIALERATVSAERYRGWR